VQASSMRVGQPSGSIADDQDLSLVAILAGKMAERPAQPMGPVSLYQAKSADQQSGDQFPSVAAEAEGTAMRDGPLYENLQYAPLKENILSFFIAVREWDGIVTDIFDKSFKGIIYSVASKRSEGQELVEVPFEFVNDYDRPKIDVGSIFRLTTGRRRTIRGQNTQATEIYFRRSGVSGACLGSSAVNFDELFTD